MGCNMAAATLNTHIIYIFFDRRLIVRNCSMENPADFG